MDTTPPLTGHVWDGCGLADHDYSSDNRTVSAWWRGFSDDESYIDHYDWCVGTARGKQDVVTCQDVGLHTRSTAELSSVVSSGITWILICGLFSICLTANLMTITNVLHVNATLISSKRLTRYKLISKPQAVVLIV